MIKLRKLPVLPILFSQNRVGKDGKSFRLYKFRTMRLGADKEQEKLRQLNEADGPVFKIRDDPRFTKFGRWLAKTGLDELPQIINVIKGEMALVGPRPLPVDEEAKIPPKWKLKRRTIKPGITSSWVVNGGHNLKFREWMELDMEDIRRKNFWHDTGIVLKTILAVAINIIRLGFAAIDKFHSNNYHFTKGHK